MQGSAVVNNLFQNIAPLPGNSFDEFWTCDHTKHKFECPNVTWFFMPINFRKMGSPIATVVSISPRRVLTNLRTFASDCKLRAGWCEWLWRAKTAPNERTSILAFTNVHVRRALNHSKRRTPKVLNVRVSKCMRCLHTKVKPYDRLYLSRFTEHTTLTFIRALCPRNAATSGHQQRDSVWPAVVLVCPLLKMVYLESWPETNLVLEKIPTSLRIQAQTVFPRYVVERSSTAGRK